MNATIDTATEAQAARNPSAAGVLAEHISALDAAELHRRFQAQGEFIALEAFLPSRVLDELLETLPALETAVHRNYIPGYKKGGSVSRFDLDRLAPAFGALYRDAALKALLESLAGRTLLECPARDPHTYALYYYTEPGDHVGFHYDTSYYRGSRYTVLIGLVDDDSDSRLEYELFRDDHTRESVTGALRLAPGALVAFNGDRLWHRVSPLGAGQRRIALTLEYVTDASMSPFRRFVSNMKDAIAYFGPRQVFLGRARRGQR